MCQSCVTAVDAVAMNAVGATVVAANCWERIVDAASGRSRAERRTATYEANAEFFASLGLDPVALIGVHPERSSSPDRERGDEPSPV